MHIFDVKDTLRLRMLQNWLQGLIADCRILEGTRNVIRDCFLPYDQTRNGATMAIKLQKSANTLHDIWCSIRSVKPRLYKMHLMVVLYEKPYFEV